MHPCPYFVSDKENLRVRRDKRKMKFKKHNDTWSLVNENRIQDPLILNQERWTVSNEKILDGPTL